jgi:hypothetical protein
MPETLESNSERVINVGPDRVTIREQQVIIEAKHPMPDWEVRELNPVPIYFEDRKFHLVHKGKAERPYAVRYSLQPWPEGHSSGTMLFFNYDAEAVAERDGGRRVGQRDELFRAFLIPVYPFLGLLWSGTQRRLTRFGFVPHAISGVSIFITFCLAFGQMVFASIMLNASARTGKVMVGGYIRALAGGDHFHIGPVSIPVWLFDCLLMLALVADFAIRYSNYLREDQWAGGFLEWLVRRKQKLAGE